jgi:hypothetical protein
VVFSPILLVVPVQISKNRLELYDLLSIEHHVHPKKRPCVDGWCGPIGNLEKIACGAPSSAFLGLDVVSHRSAAARFRRENVPSLR